ERPGKRASVSVRLEAAALVVDFRAGAEGEFTWPVVPPQAAVRGYLLPMAEGHYVPAGDAAWSRYLAGLGELSTTEEFSLPLWGLDCGGCTLTYLLTNPFNNAVTFQVRSGS